MNKEIILELVKGGGFNQFRNFDILSNNKKITIKFSVPRNKQMVAEGRKLIDFNICAFAYSHNFLCDEEYPFYSCLFEIRGNKEDLSDITINECCINQCNSVGRDPQYWEWVEINRAA